MTSTDELLCLLGDEPLPSGLETIEPAVMTRLRQHIEVQAGRRSLAVAGFIALAIGAGSGLVPQTTAQAAPSLLAVPSAAPSNLLPR